MGFPVKKGSEKGVSRRCTERPLGEYDPLGVHPSFGSGPPREGMGGQKFVPSLESQRRRDDNKNNIAFLRGGGGGREDNRPKTLIFLGKRHDLSGPYRAMRGAMRCERRCVLNTKQRCDAMQKSWRCAFSPQTSSVMRSHDAKTLDKRHNHP